MIYKTLKKVSDYCQLLDKSKYDVTQTKKGVTFTNNVDGTITANGTATGGNATFNLQSNITVVAGHKYLVSVDYTNQVHIQLYTEAIGIFASYDTANVPQIITCITTYKHVYYQIIFYDGVTVNDAILKPQLFDLTEMYGAGNEPTTVEQFRQDFPDEMYDYKPYCFVKSYKTLLKATDNKIITSYKKSLVCTTKNLFDNIVPANNCQVSFATSRAIATQIVADTDTTGLFKIVSYNGASYEVLSWIRDVLTLGRITGTFTTPETTGYKHIVFGLSGAKIDTTCLCEINLKPSTTYTFSCNFTNITQGSISWTDMQLEEGATATNYVPYGHL